MTDNGKRKKMLDRFQYYCSKIPISSLAALWDIARSMRSRVRKPMDKWFSLLAGLCILQTACAPRPSDIPRDATRQWDLLSNSTWTWTRELEHGCIAWMAKDSWASLQLIVDSPCLGDRQTGYLDGKGLTYFSVEDILVFKDYWPWSSEIYNDLFVFDEAKMEKVVLPCPYVLSSDQIEAIRLVAVEALQSAKTDGERRMLTRVRERLAVMTGDALEPSQGVCADRPRGRDENGRMITTDPWAIAK